MHTHYSTVESITSSKSSQWIEGPMNECLSALVIREKANVYPFFLALRFNIRFRWCSSMSLSLSSFLCHLPSFSLSHHVSLCISALHHDQRLLSKRKEREGAMDYIGNDLLFLLCSLSFSLLFAHPFPCPLNSVCPLKIVQHVNNKKGRGSLKSSEHPFENVVFILHSLSNNNKSDISSPRGYRNRYFRSLLPTL